MIKVLKSLRSKCITKKKNPLKSFLKDKICQRIFIGTANGYLLIGTLLCYSSCSITLKDAYISSSGKDWTALDYIIEKTNSITIWGVPKNDPLPIVLTGTITDSHTNEPITGSLIRVVRSRTNSLPMLMGYTYSGHSGRYIFSFSKDSLLPQDTIEIQVVGPSKSTYHQ